MDRGEVYRCQITLPARGGGAGGVRTKWVVVLQGGPDFAANPEVAVLVASTHSGAPPRPFEVLVGTGDGFVHDTVIDCRWPFTMLKADLLTGTLETTLSTNRMHQVSVALVRGLQLK